MRTFGATIAIFCLLAGCSAFDEASVKIDNQSNNTISETRLFVAGEDHDLGSIALGESRQFSAATSKEGGMTLSFNQGDERREVELGYVTPGLHLSCEVQISDADISDKCETR